MRNLQKGVEPPVLEANAARWLEEFEADLGNSTKRYRYREPTIKDALKLETGEKCVYCESKIGHNTPGDVEHMIPTSKERRLHFTWLNLTIACTECNRRKNDFYRQHDGFLNPYLDDVEAQLEHHGPIVSWRAGSASGEVTVGTLELSSPERMSLVQRKIGKFNEMQHLLERFTSARPGVLRELLKRQLRAMTDKSAEYSAMIAAGLRAKGVAEVFA